ncbi:TetR/AcrR family transcriptional regulator C-terminal ligand-binding domain-containing protein [Streptomyces oryzae]|uniref:TetR/AcrR family transcriptional regulator C-terminal ligand-binding domain-containing protein n=1 Tax=Streptomyces oryzae TaxID=1434886 RepID=A0ABS3XA28_9ACTN|nr:TetR-like C-terminal domain-containing protein [Streptomyces oryzae]MBO8191917.1 TetR/AcrR family transcriptional regulator C-terminal ligand-binding domain-containing protein [Streptomyces oryzae]
MTAPRPHGSTRPGGRTARTRAAVLKAAWDELGTREFSDITIDRIARRSGVHAATIRRRWRTIEGVITDMLGQHSGTIPIPDTGSLREDLHTVTRSIAEFYALPRNRRLVEAVVTSAAREPGAAEVMRAVFKNRIKQVSVLLERAVERGEVPADTDAEEVIAAIGAPFYYRLLITRRPIDTELARISAESAYLAAVEGVFRTDASPD